MLTSEHYQQADSLINERYGIRLIDAGFEYEDWGDIATHETPEEAVDWIADKHDLIEL